MKRSEELYADFVFEYGVEDFVFGVAFVQSVAVSYKELLSVFFKAERFAVKDKSEFFFKVISLPKVVIAAKEVYLAACIAHLCQLSEKSHISFGNNIFVLEPKVKYVAKKVNLFGTIFYVFQPANCLFLSFYARFAVGRTEVEVAYKVNLIFALVVRGVHFALAAFVR